LAVRNFSTITPSIEKEIELYSKKKQTSVSLRSLMDSGRGENPNLPTLKASKASDKVLMQVACFLHRELPVRFSHRATKLEASALFNKSGKSLQLPSVAIRTSTYRLGIRISLLTFIANIRNVSSWYKTSFAQIRACPVPQDPEKEAMFAKVIESIYERHGSTLITMAKGAHELRTMLKHDVNAFADSNDIQERLDEFYMSRIGIRMVSSVPVFCILGSLSFTLKSTPLSALQLIGQYLALRNPDDANPDVVGLINSKASPYEIAQEVIVRHFNFLSATACSPMSFFRCPPPSARPLTARHTCARARMETPPR